MLNWLREAQALTTFVVLIQNQAEAYLRHFFCWRKVCLCRKRAAVYKKASTRRSRFSQQDVIEGRASPPWARPATAQPACYLHCDTRTTPAYTQRTRRAMVGTQTRIRTTCSDSPTTRRTSDWSTRSTFSSYRVSEGFRTSDDRPVDRSSSTGMSTPVVTTNATLEQMETSRMM